MAKPMSWRIGLRPSPIERGGVEAKERVRGQEHEGQKARADHRLHAQHAGAEAVRQVAAEEGDAAAEERQDPDPEDERALVVPPHPADLVDQGLGRVRVGDDVGDREVGRDVGVDQGGKGDGDGRQLHEARRDRDTGERRVVAMGAPERQHRLDQGQAEGQDQGVVTELDDHCGLPSPSRCQ